MQTTSIEFGKRHWDQVAEYAGLTRQELLQCRRIQQFFIPNSTCSSKHSWVLPNGKAISVYEHSYCSKVILFDDIEEFNQQQKRERNYDRAMTPDPETGRRPGLYR